MIPAGFIQDLLSRTDVADVVGQHVELKKAGINYKGLCPFHGEKTPSFIVSPSRQTYHCFGCGVHGDALRFLTDHLGLSFIEAVQDLAQRVGMQVPQDEASATQRAEAAQQRQHQATLTEVLAKAAEHYRKQLRTSARAIDYLKGRGLNGEIAKRFGLGYAPEGWRSLASGFARYDDPLLVESGLVILQGGDEKSAAEAKRYDRFRDRIMFPIRNVKGETIGFGGRVLDGGEPKYLNSPETPVFHKGQELYGLCEARTGLREKGYALVTEGYMDVVALAQLGFPNAVATLGTACTADHVHKLLRFTDQVTFSFDGDAAGRRAASRALEAALPHASDTRQFRFLFLPTEHDPDSYVRTFGAEAFERFVRDAVPLSRQLIEQASDDCDLSTAEGRAKMLSQARPLWSSLPEGSLRLQLLGDIARLGGLQTSELVQLWQASAGRGKFAARAEPARGDTDASERGAGGRPWHERRHGGDSPQRFGGRRQAPRSPQDRVVQLLFGEPGWWDQLSSAEHALLHALPAPHGTIIAWLERQLAEHGPRPWAVIRQALAADEQIDDLARALADGDALPDATLSDLHAAVGWLMLRDLDTQLETLVAQISHDPQALKTYQALSEERKLLKQRQSQLAQSPDE